MAIKKYTKLEDENTIYNVRSSSQGVTVEKTIDNGEEVFTVNIDTALNSRATIEQVNTAITENNNKRSQSITKYQGTYTIPSKFKYHNGDAKPVLSYNPLTSFGVLKVDATFYQALNQNEIVAEFPVGTPQPVEYIEVQLYVDGTPVSMWYNGRHLRTNSVPQSLVGKRVIMNFIGLFK